MVEGAPLPSFECTDYYLNPPSNIDELRRQSVLVVKSKVNHIWLRRDELQDCATETVQDTILHT
jgi:hypothetical protein